MDEDHRYHDKHSITEVGKVLQFIGNDYNDKETK